MTRIFALARIFLCLMLLTLPMNFAAAKKHPPARRHQTLISKISPTSLTIDEDSAPRTFVITHFTEVTLNDQKASLNQLKKGMRVSVTLDDPTHVRQIKAWDVK